jgi:hypothetical protein
MYKIQRQTWTIGHKVLPLLKIDYENKEPENWNDKIF